MREIWIPEFFIIFFLLLPIIRPFVKKLLPIEGISCLPFLSLLFLVILVPAYGFRPEVLPLFAFTVLVTAMTVMRRAKRGAHFASLRETRLFPAIPLLALLAVSGAVAFFFTPAADTALSTEGVDTLLLRAGAEVPGGGETEYSVRVYSEKNGNASLRPLLILVPPVFGSLSVVDRVCGELRDRGFTVLSYARRGVSSWRGLRPLFSGTVSGKANACGRRLEEERKKDILFLLSWIGGNPRVNENTELFGISSPDAVFLAGYDAGGSALLLLGNSLSPDGQAPVFSRGIKIRGLIAVESYLWSAYRAETPAPDAIPPDSGWFASAGYGLKRRLNSLKPAKIAAAGEIPKISLPLLFLVSDKSREPEQRDGRCRALFECFRSARAYAAVSSADGAGPLDYSDFPALYPVITFLFPGRQKPAWDNADAPGGTAGIITAFAAGIMEADATASPLVKEPVSAGVRTEYRNSSGRGIK